MRANVGSCEYFYSSHAALLSCFSLIDNEQIFLLQTLWLIYQNLWPVHSPESN